LILMLNTFYCQKINWLIFFAGGGYGFNKNFENVHAKVQYVGTWVFSFNIGLKIMESII
jgi:hypothetical protein